jgi:hypothetical protein
MKTRTDLLNHLADKYNLQTYLEIGVQNPAINFDKIKIRAKQSVDPDPNARAIWCETSDDFFEHWKPVVTIDVTTKDSEQPEYISSDRRFDLIFIDGLHTAEQVKKDFENALKILSPDGFIVLHDCNPEKEEHTIVPRPTERGHWNGDVYKFAFAFYESPHVFTVDIDNGCMVIQNKVGLRWNGVDYLNWDFFDENRKELLNLISWDEFVSIGPHV